MSQKRQKDLLENPEVSMEFRKRDFLFSMVAALMIAILSVFGFLSSLHGNYLAWWSVSWFHPSIFYGCLSLLDTGFGVIFLTKVRAVERKDAPGRHEKLLFEGFCFINILCANLTLFSAQKGTDLFFEYILFTVAIALFPLIDGKTAVILTGWNVGVLLISFAARGHALGWQDIVDLVALHAFCIAISQLRWSSFMDFENVLINLFENEKRLFFDSRTDGLTGTLNRTALREDFEGYLDADLCVALLDIDTFKCLNDTHGHEFGDRVLKTVGANLNSIFYEEKDACYRYGGDEFLIISREPKNAIFKDKLTQVQSLFEIRIAGTKVNLSIGYCVGHVDTATDLRKCLRVADKYLYEVKNNGRKGIRGGLVRNQEMNEKDDV